MKNLLKWIKKWWGWDNFKTRMRIKILLKKINHRNKKFWRGHTVEYTNLPDGTPCTHIKRK
jgi:hypothetical protein